MQVGFNRNDAAPNSNDRVSNVITIAGMVALKSGSTKVHVVDAAADNLRLASVCDPKNLFLKCARGLRDRVTHVCVK